MSITQSKPGKNQWIDLALRGGEEGREDQQAGWQRYVGQLFSGVSILDVGAGLGHSRQRLSRVMEYLAHGTKPNLVVLQDPGPGLAATGLVDLALSVEALPERSFDVVTAFDAIEHVADDLVFVAALKRIARQFVFISTPNERISGAHNRHHVREYAPAELIELVGDSKSFGADPQCFAGEGDGSAIVPLSREEFLKHNLPHHAVLLSPAQT